MKASRIFWSAAIILLYVATMVSSCYTQSRSNYDHKLVASIEPLRAITQEIAGDDWQVSAIVPEGFSPEDYSLSAALMGEVEDARCVFKVGRLGFETIWLPRIQHSNPRLPIVDTSEGINEAEFDPHTWTAPRNIKIIAQNICRALCEADSAHAAAYADRLHTLEVKADSLDSAICRLLDGISTRTFIITHPALTHFAAHYGLRQLAIEPDGKEPTPASMQALVAEAKAEGVQVVFVQQEFADRSARIIADQASARVVSINPLSADWYGELLRIAQALSDGK